MRLTYRGASYELNASPLEVQENAVLRNHGQNQQRCRTLQENRYPLTYRGVRYTTDQVATALSAPMSRSEQTLTYRGVKYVRNADGSTQLAPSTEKLSVPNTTMAALKELSRVHQENLRQNLARRLQAAKSRGDHELVNLLEAESKQLAL